MIYNLKEIGVDLSFCYSPHRPFRSSYVPIWFAESYSKFTLKWIYQHLFFICILTNTAFWHQFLLYLSFKLLGLAYFPLSAAPVSSSSPPSGFAEPSCKFALKWINQNLSLYINIDQLKFTFCHHCQMHCFIHILGSYHFPLLNAETSTDVCSHFLNHLPNSLSHVILKISLHYHNLFNIFLALRTSNNQNMIIKWFSGLLLSLLSFITHIKFWIVPFVGPSIPISI